VPLSIPRLAYRWALVYLALYAVPFPLYLFPGVSSLTTPYENAMTALVVWFGETIVRLGKGAVIDLGANINPILGDLFVETAQQENIAHQISAAPGATGATHLLHCPGQPGFDGGSVLVDIVSVQAQAGFQPQRIARAQARGPDIGLCQQLASQRFGRSRGHRNFETVFTGVAGARDEAVRAV